jgi:hypothetical protein
MEKLRRQADDQQTEIMVLPKKSPKDMWNVDLDKFLADPASTMAMTSLRTVIPGENQHGKDLNVIISNSMPKSWLHGGQNGAGVTNGFNGTDNDNRVNSYAQPNSSGSTPPTNHDLNPDPEILPSNSPSWIPPNHGMFSP